MKDRTLLGRFLRKKDQEKRDATLLPAGEEAPLPGPAEPIKVDKQPKRNDPCSCGSGKKYKKCCGKGGS